MKATGKFTLIELLIVISIIMILAALLLPALRSAKNTSYDISCKSNLKQIALLHQNYIGDYGYWANAGYADGYNATEYGTSAAGLGAPSWAMAFELSGYVSNGRSLFTTPNDAYEDYRKAAKLYCYSGAKEPILPALLSHSLNGLRNVSYVMIKAPNTGPNWINAGGRHPVGSATYVKAGSIPSPSTKAVNVDGGVSESRTSGMYNYNEPAFPHRNKCNANYADGHAESFSYKVWFEGGSSTNYRNAGVSGWTP
ncbi:MAG: hypothetical protein A2020_04205 [Lentisphaerae bacterium GWF2_45_14]|nr:MAG: hypothetical protein A2020_04205 [Lentisphaerae bacterium GWF2_45_14]